MFGCTSICAQNSFTVQSLAWYSASVTGQSIFFLFGISYSCFFRSITAYFQTSRWRDLPLTFIATELLPIFGSYPQSTVVPDSVRRTYIGKGGGLVMFLYIWFSHFSIQYPHSVLNAGKNPMVHRLCVMEKQITSFYAPVVFFPASIRLLFILSVPYFYR